MPVQLTLTLDTDQIRVMGNALGAYLWQRQSREWRETHPHDRDIARELLSIVRYGPLDLR